MKSKVKEEHWSFAALRQRLSKRTQIIDSPQTANRDNEPRILRTIIPTDWEYGTIFLFDPELKETIENYFYCSLYPPIDKINLTELGKTEARLNALFLMTDPQRPVLTPESPWWYVCYNLEVSDGGYFLRTELHLSIPFSIPSEWILEFLAEAADWNDPLSVTTDRDEFVLNFSWGQGRSFPALSDDWENHLIERFIKHIKIAQVIDRFSRQPEKHILRNEMLEIIKTMYG